MRVGAAFYAERADGAFLARRRPPHGLLASTMELPTGIWAEGEIETVGSEAVVPAAWRRLPGYVNTYSPTSPCGSPFLSAKRGSMRRQRVTHGLIYGRSQSWILRPHAQGRRRGGLGVSWRGCQKAFDRALREKTVMNTILISSHSDQLST